MIVYEILEDGNGRFYNQRCIKIGPFKFPYYGNREVDPKIYFLHTERRLFISEEDARAGLFRYLEDEKRKQNAGRVVSRKEISGDDGY